MADNVAITAGAGTSIATDDVGSVHFQKVKLDVGSDGTSLQSAGSIPVYVVSGTGAYLMNDPFVDAVAIAGQMDDTSFTAATENNVAPVRITASRALHVYINSGVAFDSDGAIYVHPYSSNIWHYTQEFSSAQTDYVIKSGTTNLSLYLETVTFSTSNATITGMLEQGTTVAKWKYYASGTANLFNQDYVPPIKLTAGSNLSFTSTGTGTCFLGVTGFTAA